MKARLSFASLFVALLIVESPAIAGDFWGSVARVIAAPITVPAQTTVDIIRGDDPTKAIKQQGQDMGVVVNRSVSVAQSVHDQIAGVPRNLITQNLGGDWTNAYDLMTGADRVQVEMGFTAGRFLGGCLGGAPCNINQLVAMPLAASLRDAYKIYAPQSQPLDPSAIQLLQRVIPMNVLANARIVIGNTPNFTAPGFLNAGYNAAGNGFAVTIGNVMIFSRPLNPMDINDWIWLMHELHHTEQYAQYSNNVLESIDGFSVSYLQYSANMESDARQTAANRSAQLQNICSQYGGC